MAPFGGLEYLKNPKRISYAFRRMGEISKTLEKAHKVGRGTTVQLPGAGKLKATILREAGVSTSQAHRAEKLEAQAEFVFWWDTQAEKSEGNKHGRIPSDTAVVAGKNGIPDKKTLSPSWRISIWATG